jgi:DNA-directed RNA polymerase subunit K/omega
MSAKNEKELDAKLMNFDGDRYDVVVLSSMWAKELKKKPEYKDQPNAVVIKVALDDILSGRVSKEEVLNVSKDNLEKELKAQEEARKEAERKAKEPMRL